MNKQPTLYLNQDNLQFANNYNHNYISNTDRTNTGNKEIVELQIYNKDNLYRNIFMQITSTYMAHSDYSNSSISSLQGNA